MQEDATTIDSAVYRDSNLPGEISALISQSRVDGLILTPPLSDLSDIIRRLQAQEIPFVRIAPADMDSFSPSVATNDYQAAFDMTCFLVSQGHTKIGFISGHPDHRSVARRLGGYIDALGEHGIRVSKHLIVQGYNSFESGIACARTLLQRKLPPTAVFASNDDMAAGVIKVAHEQGLNIPGDLSVAGFDDTPVAQQIWPSLTTVRQPIKTMAEKAASLLLESLRDKAAPEIETAFMSELVIRNSTGPCRK